MVHCVDPYDCAQTRGTGHLRTECMRSADVSQGIGSAVPYGAARYHANMRCGPALHGTVCVIRMSRKLCMKRIRSFAFIRYINPRLT